jgi:hypothetical protein
MSLLEFLNDDFIRIARKKLKLIVNSNGGIVEAMCDVRLKFLLENSKMIISNLEMLIGLFYLEKVRKIEKDLDVFKNHADTLYMFVACLGLAHKIQNDMAVGISFWCSEGIGNLLKEDMVRCEMMICRWLNFHLFVSEKELKDFLEELGLDYEIE